MSDYTFEDYINIYNRNCKTLIEMQRLNVQPDHPTYEKWKKDCAELTLERDASLGRLRAFQEKQRTLQMEALKKVDAQLAKEPIPDFVIDHTRRSCDFLTARYMEDSGSNINIKLMDARRLLMRHGWIK